MKLSKLILTAKVKSVNREQNPVWRLAARWSPLRFLFQIHLICRRFNLGNVLPTYMNLGG